MPGPDLPPAPEGSTSGRLAPGYVSMEPDAVTRDGTPSWQRSAELLPDVGYLLRDLLTDRRVPWHAKVLAGAALVYVTPPTRGLISRRMPIGVVGEFTLVLVAFRRLVAAAGYEVVRERWRGDHASFVWLLLLSGIDA